MTVLSKALTAETPEERAQDVGNRALLFQVFGPLAGDALREFYTNERTLFIAAGRGDIAVQGVPAHMLSQPPGDGKGGQATTEQGVEGKAVGVPTSSQPAPETSGGYDKDADLQKLIASLKPGNILSMDQFRRVRDVIGPTDAWPTGAVERLERLRRMNAREVHYILTGVSK